MENLGARLKKAREQKNATQADVAKKLGIPRGTYAYYELGKRSPDYELLVHIAKYYDVTVHYLLGIVDSVSESMTFETWDKKLFAAYLYRAERIVGSFPVELQISNEREYIRTELCLTETEYEQYLTESNPNSPTDELLSKLSNITYNRISFMELLNVLPDYYIDFVVYDFIENTKYDHRWIKVINTATTYGLDPDTLNGFISAMHMMIKAAGR